MDQEKDIRYTDKKVDESWKENMTRDKVQVAAKADGGERKSPNEKNATGPTSKHFVNLVSSLGYQAMMQLGELPEAGGQGEAVNLEAAREIIDLMADLKSKTAGNLNAEESRLINNLLTELQLKFSQKV